MNVPPPAIPKALAQNLDLLAAVLLPTLPEQKPTPALPAFPAYTPALDVAALLTRLMTGEDDEEAAQSASAWAASAAAPLRHQAVVKRTAGWRKARGLAIDSAKETRVFFGAAKSGNFLLLDKDDAPLSRAEFYTLALPAFAAAVATVKPGTDTAKWKTLAEALIKDDGTSNGWPAPPADGGLKASQFIQQFVRDCLAGEMGMLDGPPPADPPLLKALGEHRRSGNHYTREDAELRRNQLIKELQKTPA